MSNSTGNPSLSTGNATDSICPYGWQLAEYTQGRTVLQSYNMIEGSAYYGTDVRRRADVIISPLRLIRSNAYGTGSYSATGVYANQAGFWLTKSIGSVNGNKGPYVLRIDLDSATSHRTNSGYAAGYSLRCLAR